MNVLQLISSEGYYGAENMLVHLSGALRGFGCRSVVGVFENLHRPNLEVAERARSHGIPVEVIRCNGKADWNAVRQIRECVATHQIDLIHAHGYKANLYGYAAARPLNLPLVATCHNWTRQSASVRLYDIVDSFVVRRFDAVVAVSDVIAETLQGFGIVRSRISTIANGMDFSQLLDATPTLRRELPPASLIVGTVCRLVELKGLEYLLEAARQILEVHGDVRFVIVGDGPARQKLQESAKQKGIADRVTFAGLRSDIPGVYASFDIFVLPSTDEGMPMVLLEALAAGLPTVATRVGDVPKLIQSENTGILIPSRDVAAIRDSLLRLITDPRLRAKMAREGRQFVIEQFSARAMADRYFSLYRQLVAVRAAA